MLVCCSTLPWRCSYTATVSYMPQFSTAHMRPLCDLLRTYQRTGFRSLPEMHATVTSRHAGHAASTVFHNTHFCSAMCTRAFLRIPEAGRQVSAALAARQHGCQRFRWGVPDGPGTRSSTELVAIHLIATASQVVAAVGSGSRWRGHVVDVVYGVVVDS